MPEEVYLELENIGKEYRDIKAVDQLSLKVFKGDIYGFLGPNGAGKSTSIRMILSLIKPASGTIRLFGKDLAVNRYKTLSRVGALIEKPDFYKYLSARKNLEILGKLSNVKKLSPKIDEVLELVKLKERQHSRVKTYSQGMRQRLGIAQSLLHEPDLIILDEPANGLDPQGQKEMRQLIQKLNTERGITFIVSSHILAEIEQLANRMIIINKGRRIVEGNVRELLDGSGAAVNFEVSATDKAMQIANSIEEVQVLKQMGENTLSISIARDRIPPLLSELEKNKISVYSVVPVRTLEEYFISKTGNE